MIVFDTDVVSALMRPKPAAGLVARRHEFPLAVQATTTITLGSTPTALETPDAQSCMNAGVGC